MSQITLQQFTNKYGNPQNPTSDVYLNGILTLILPSQNQAENQIIKEIELQNSISKSDYQYLNVIEFAFSSNEQQKKVYMKIEAKQIINQNNSSLQLFKNICQSQEKYKPLKQLMSLVLDFEQGKKQATSLIHAENLFYLQDQFYFTIFGISQKLGNEKLNNQVLDNIKDYNDKIVSLKYSDQQNNKQAKDIKQYRLDLGVFLLKYFLDIQSSSPISIKQINEIKSKPDTKIEKKIIVDIINDLWYSEKIIKDIKEDFENQFSNQNDIIIIYEEWIYRLNQNTILKQFLKEEDFNECLKKTLDYNTLRQTLEVDIIKYVEKLKVMYDKFQDKQTKKQAYLFHLQGFFRLQALKLMKGSCEIQDPCLIYYLNEQELNQLLKDKNKILSKYFTDGKLRVEDQIKKYLKILQQSLYLSDNQLQFVEEAFNYIPMKYFKESKHQKIQELYYEKGTKIKQDEGVELFGFDEKLEALYLFNKFMLNKPQQQKYFSNDRQINYCLSVNHYKVLDKNQKEKYLKQLIDEIKTLQKMKQNQDIQSLLEEYLTALNKFFVKVVPIKDSIKKQFKDLLYKENENYSIFDFGLQIVPNKFGLSEKLKKFCNRRFSGHVMIDDQYFQLFRKFSQSENIENYEGGSILNTIHGVGVKKINNNHLLWGLFICSQFVWGWEIKFQNNVCSFYKGAFLDEKKSGNGIQQKIKIIEETQSELLIEEYEGEFLKDQRSGYGELKIIESQKIYKGYFKDDKLNGFAVEYQENDKDAIVKGYFVDGNLGAKTCSIF